MLLRSFKVDSKRSTNQKKKRKTPEVPEAPEAITPNSKTSRDNLKNLIKSQQWNCLQQSNTSWFARHITRNLWP